jgi:para-aminobenzoate synthetase/4-amino-4-deoxychorismate lyase
LADVPRALEHLRTRLRQGLFAAGWLSYEAGLVFEQRLMERVRRPDQTRLPLVWFGLFEDVARAPVGEIAKHLPDAAGAWLSPPRPRMTRTAYDAAFARAKNYIVAGDIYQVNLSYRADLTLVGDPLAAYARLRGAGQGGWSGVVHDGANWLLSTSPELFFRVAANGAIEARPMKGTVKRCDDPEQDRRAAERLKSDPKQIAENVMIVDLIRNDLSRLAKQGSVHVPELMAVETYPTLHALTSTVRAALREEHDIVDVLRALFPCGSVTGAPKIRAMEIISELETDQRGPYTGSIGWIAPDGSAEFNVAIRTIAVAGGRAEVGLGSAVVFDSTAESEWSECQTKGAFIIAGAQAFELIETMRFEPKTGIARLDLHLARLEASARTFEFVFDEAAIRAALAAATGRLPDICILRMAMSADGTVKIEPRSLPPAPAGKVDAVLLRLPVASTDFRLRHKTTLRDFYDVARATSGAYEVVFVDEAGFVTEGSFTNVFVERDGGLVTPPVRRSLLPGVLRQTLLASGRAIEGDLRAVDLANGFYLGNAARGLVAATLSSIEARHGK